MRGRGNNFLADMIAPLLRKFLSAGVSSPARGHRPHRQGLGHGVREDIEEQDPKAEQIAALQLKINMQKRTQERLVARCRDLSNRAHDLEKDLKAGT